MVWGHYREVEPRKKGKEGRNGLLSLGYNGDTSCFQHQALANAILAVVQNCFLSKPL